MSSGRRDLIFLGEGGGFWPLFACALSEGSFAVRLSRLMHQVAAAGFHVFFYFSFDEFRFWLFRIRTMALLGDCPPFVSMANSAIQVVLSPKLSSTEGKYNVFAILHPLFDL